MSIERGFNPERFGGSETGRLYEEKLLGKALVNEAFVTAERAIPRNERGRYRNDDDAYDLVRNYQPVDDEGNQDIPQTAVDILDEVRVALALKAEEYDNVRFYTAVGTPIDVKMGVDGWFEFTDPLSKQSSRVTVDVTRNQRKLNEGYGKADVMIGVLPDAIQEENEYFEAIEELGHEVASELQRRIGSAEA